MSAEQVNQEQPGEGRRSPPVPIIEVDLDSVVIRPDLVDRVTFTVSVGPFSWLSWEFELRKTGGAVYSSWTRTPGTPDRKDALTATYTVTNLEIDPVYSERDFTFLVRAVPQYYSSVTSSTAGTFPSPPSAVTAEYMPGPPRLALDWQWSDAQRPAGATARFLMRIDSNEPQAVADDLRAATLAMPETTTDSSRHLFSMETEYTVVNGKVTVTSYSAWVPGGGLEIIVASPEEVVSAYDPVANEVRVSWTQPSEYGVSGYEVDYSVAGGVSRSAGFSGTTTDSVAIPAGEIPGYDPGQKDSLTGQVRAIGNNGAAYVACGPGSATAQVEYPSENQLILTSIVTSFSGKYVATADEWQAYPNATKYNLYIGMFNGDSAIDNIHKTVTTTSGSITYNNFAYDPTKTYKTNVIPYDSHGHVAGNYTWIPMITAVPQNIQFYYRYRAESNAIYLYAEWDPIPDSANTVYDILLTVSGHDPIQVTTEPNETSYSSKGPAEPGVAYTIQIRAQDLYTVPDSVDRTSAQSAPPRTAKGADQTEYQVIRYGPWSAVVPAGTMLSRTFVYDSAGRLGRATTGTRTNEYTYDVRDNLVQVQEKT